MSHPNIDRGNMATAKLVTIDGLFAEHFELIKAKNLLNKKNKLRKIGFVPYCVNPDTCYRRGPYLASIMTREKDVREFLRNNRAKDRFRIVPVFVKVP